MPAIRRVLVIGSDGFVGRNLARYCESLSWDVVKIGRGEGDLSDWQTTKAAFQSVAPVHRIFHVVTRQRTGDTQYKIQGELLAINSRIHLNVLEAWRLFQPQAKLVCPGSSCTYPESETALDESRFGTGLPHSSVAGYAQAKMLLSRGCETYASQYGLKYLITVFATVYGPWDHKEADRSHFFGAMIERALRERAAGSPHLTIWGNPNTVRELLYVDDQIAAMLAADEMFENCVLNCACNSPVTVGAAAHAILSALDWKVSVRSLEGSFQGAGFKVLNSDKFLAATDFQPRYHLVDGVRHLLKEEAAS